MDMLNKLTSLFQQALETREPSVNLQDSFVDHWKGITNYYIETTDESKPVRQTDIPWRLKQMLDILVYEESHQEVEETGPCMEYLLQHKILETLCTLGKAQYPPGMSQQVLVFFAKVLAQIQKPMLHIINVYRPVQKLIRLCGLPGSETEKEESQFLHVVCLRVKKDPYVLNYILEISKEALSHMSSSTSDDGVDDETGGASSPYGVPSPPSSQPCTVPSPCNQRVPHPDAPPLPQNPSASPASPATLTSPDTGLIQVLVHLSKSQKSRVSLRAMESLVLLASLPQEDTAVLLAEGTPLCHLLAQRLCELYRLLPPTLDPADIHSFPVMEWRTQVGAEEKPSFTGSEQVETFFSWLDFCDQLIKDSPKILAAKLTKAIHQQWLMGILQPQLLQMSEAGILTHTALLCGSVRQINSPALLEELLQFLLGSDTQGEQCTDTHTHTLRYHLIERCDHISDEISISSLRLFEELLRKPSRNVLTNLVLRNLEQCSYRLPAPGGGDERHGVEADPLDDSVELEEDPFFTDMYSDREFSGSETLLSLPGPQKEPRPSPQTQVADVVNSFLCLVPQEAKSSQHVQGAGYDTYVHDAHTLYKECAALSLDWGWPDSPKPVETSSSPSSFYEGHFLKVLFDRIARILEQPYELNLQVTSVLSRLAVFPHPLLHEYLLNPYISLTPGARSLFSMLVRVIGELMQRIQHIPNFTEKLVHVRKQLMGLEEETMVDHVTLLRGVIVLEEFCKELAAISFIKLPMEEQYASHD
ncbi:FHF complex subunit HOOK-interacting protein 2B [Chanos chanos]|uniref:FHF complex subunit HOOK-interacting protein 2B n=1 Tax=Chanos chanos TaxID=29144 RepID=A0A6J2V492_CHACN|nr:protein FAM160B2 [Chanos chanos]